MMKLPITMTEEEYTSFVESDQGMCLACGEVHDAIEPDASGYTCDNCEEEQVMAYEQMLVEGKVVFVDVSENDE